jgi:transposase-like protein
MRTALARAGKEQMARRLRLHCHGLRSGHAGGGKHSVVQRRRPDQAKSAEAYQSNGQRRARRARLHDLPKQHWTKLHSTDPIARLNGEIKRRTEVVGIFPNDDATVRLVGALLLKQNGERPSSDLAI